MTRSLFQPASPDSAFRLQPFAVVTLLTGLLLSATGCLAPAPPHGLVIWAISGEEELTTNTAPNLENDVYSAARQELRLAAAINETVDFQLGLTSSATPAGPFSVEISDLAGPTDTLASRDVIRLYRVQYTRVEQFRSWYTRYTGRPATPTLVPDVLVPWDAPRGGGPVTLNEQRNEIVWVDVAIPPTASPGDYRGRVVVRNAAGTAVFTSELRVEVLPIALPGRRSLPVVCRVDPRDLLTAHLRWPREGAEQTRLLPNSPNHFAAVRLVGATMQMLHEHRLTPVLWAAFPKYRPVGERQVEVDWTEYDALVSGWLDGSAFADRDPLEVWPIPASLDYPSADQNGGLESPQYARLLAAYLAECRRHFAERGWLDRAVLRIAPPQPLSQMAVDQIKRLGAILRQSEAPLPLIAHLPAGSLRGLGWHEAPAIALPDVGTWAPPAMWYEPELMDRERKLGHATWFMPDHPPFSGSLTTAAPLLDAWTLPWLAYRYSAGGIWLEHATEFAASAPSPTAQEPWIAAPLIYPAEDFGLREAGPVPSLRLKRLRRGLQDYELLKLLEANGETLLAQKVTEQIIRWGMTDACLDNLLDTKEAGWPLQASALRLARILILRELASTFAPSPAARQNQIASLSEWSLMFNQAERVTATVDGVRLTSAATGLNARVYNSVSNATNRPIDGRWILPAPPAEWQPTADVVVNVAPGTRRSSRLDVFVTGLAYNTEGVYPFDVALDTTALGAFTRTARLAVAACPRPERVPVVDGQLDDWPLASNNAAGDFRLARGGAQTGGAPTLPTRAFFCMDQTNLYVGVQATLRGGEPPLWQSDNTIPIDGTIPWSQDVIEVLIDPRPTADGTSSDLYCLQIKPSGLLVARKGCRTEPPMGTSETWQCGARVAVKVQRESWTVELALPLEALGPQARRNPIWGMNVTRLDARRGEYSSWSGARGYCYTPRALGNLIMLWP